MAVTPLLHRYVAICIESDAHPNAQKLKSEVIDLSNCIGRTSTRGNLDQLLRTLDALPSGQDFRGKLLQTIGKVGPPQVVTPLFLKEIGDQTTQEREDWFATSRVAREYIGNDSDPRAVAFLLKELQDPKAPPNLKREAYWHLAGTGGDVGAEAVLKLKNKQPSTWILRSEGKEQNLSSLPISESEQVLAAAFEARFHFPTPLEHDPSESAEFTMPEVVRPFQMIGRTGPTYWVRSPREPWTDSKSNTLQISFECPSGDVGSNWPRRTDPQGAEHWYANRIWWNRNRTDALVVIETHKKAFYMTFNWLSLKKYRGNWIVYKAQ